MTQVSDGAVIKADPTKSRKLCKKWYLQVLVDGKVKRKRFTGTIHQAYTALLQFRKDVADEVCDTTINFKKFSALWLDYRSKLDLAETTHKSDGVFVNTLNYFFGNKDIQDITRQEIEEIFWKMKIGETRYGTAFSEKYRLDLYITLNQIFKRAIQIGYLTVNPAASVQKPRVPKTQKRALTKEQYIKLMHDLDFSNGTQAGIALCACLGLRRSEATQLVFGDFDGEFVQIKKSKTESGIRSLPINDYVKQIYNARYNAQISLLGRVTPETPFVGNVKIPNESLLTHWWINHREKFGLPGITVHELRHTFLTLLAEADVHPRYMQQLAGHSSPITTLEIYTHVHSEHLKSAMQQFNDLTKN